MTLDEITSALKSSDTTPLAALRAGVAKTDELAPLIFAIAEKLCRGVYLLPGQNDLLFYGLHILAAAVPAVQARSSKSAAEAPRSRRHGTDGRVVAFGWWGFSAVPIFRPQPPGHGYC